MILQALTEYYQALGGKGKSMLRMDKGEGVLCPLSGSGRDVGARRFYADRTAKGKKWSLAPRSISLLPL